MSLEEEKKTVTGCIDCKYRHPLKRICMLGRDPVRCASPHLRRGDEGLYRRILELTPEQLQDQRRRETERRRRENRSKKNLGILRNSDWS